MRKQEIIRKLKESKIDINYVTVRKDFVIVNNRSLAKLSKKKARNLDIEVRFSRSYEEICRKVARTVSKYKIIRPRDKIVVGFSGGKDSTILLHVLEAYQRKFGITLIAATVDVLVGEDRPWKKDGEGYRIIKKTVENLDIQHYLFSYNENVEEIAEMLSRGKHKFSPCFSCSVVRRSFLTDFMNKIGANSIALAHTLDDNAETILSRMFKGEEIETLPPVKEFNQCTIGNINLKRSRIIRPLIEVKESLIRSAVEELGLEYFKDKEMCKYSRERGDTLRRKIHEFLDVLEKETPNIREMIVASAMKVCKLI